MKNKMATVLIVILCVMIFVPKVQAQFQYLLASGEVTELRNYFNKKTGQMEERIAKLEKRLAALESKK